MNAAEAPALIQAHELRRAGPQPRAGEHPAQAARTHICRGSGEMPRTRDVELKDIIDTVVTAKPADLMLMASNGRPAHERKAFQDARLPDGKDVIPGALDPAANIAEHPEVAADRLIRCPRPRAGTT